MAPRTCRCPRDPIKPQQRPISTPASLSHLLPHRSLPERQRDETPENSCGRPALFRGRSLGPVTAPLSDNSLGLHKLGQV